MHTLLLVSCIAEVAVFHRPFLPWLGWPMVGVVALSTVLRWWCVAVLGKRWNPRLIVIPGAPLVHRGPYRFLHHPWRASNLPDCGPNRVRFGKESRSWHENTRNTSPSSVTR